MLETTLKTVISKESENSRDLSPIVQQLGAITRQSIEAFACATKSEHYSDAPPTYPTIFRSTEFRWLDRLHIDLHQLLHTEQEYEYLQPLREGDVPTISTVLTEHRERRGLLFISLESHCLVKGQPTVISRATFVVRRGTGVLT